MRFYYYHSADYFAWQSPKQTTTKKLQKLRNETLHQGFTRPRIFRLQTIIVSIATHLAKISFLDMAGAATVVTFSCGETLGGICACSFSVSQLRLASSSHSACILSQNSVSDWRKRSEEINECIAKHTALVFSRSPCHPTVGNVTSALCLAGLPTPAESSRRGPALKWERTSKNRCAS